MWTPTPAVPRPARPARPRAPVALLQHPRQLLDLVVVLQVLLQLSDLGGEPLHAALQPWDSVERRQRGARAAPATRARTQPGTVGAHQRREAGGRIGPCAPPQPFQPRPASGSLSRLTLRPRAPEGRPRDRARMEGRVLMGGPGTGRGPPSVGPVCWRGAGRGGPQTSSPQAQPLRYWGEATEAAGATRLKCPLAPCQSVAEQVFAFHPRDSCFSGFPSRGGGDTPFTGSLIQARPRVNPHTGAPCTTTRQQRRRRPRRKVTGQRLTEASSQ